VAYVAAFDTGARVRDGADWGHGAEHVLFLDDNILNVEAAKRFGIQAMRVQGIGETRRALIERGIIEEGEG
jgi:FMN phosphatase YigB (HAD superfamily)